MRLRSGLAIAVLLLVGACGEASEKPKDESTKETSPSTSEPTMPTDLESVVVAPGKVGPLVVGMSAKDALDKGLVRESKTAPCPGFEATGPLQDVAVLFSGSEPEATLLGVLVKVKGPKTTEGIGVGSSITDVKAAYGDELRREKGEYGETPYRIYDGDRAVGFVISDESKSATKIDAIEVFSKSDPVVWDGC
jgi:hypothetical protein